MAPRAILLLTCKHALVHNAVSIEQDGVARHDASVRRDYQQVTRHQFCTVDIVLSVP